jgi:hypothetical protein
VFGSYLAKRAPPAWLGGVWGEPVGLDERNSSNNSWGRECGGFTPFVRCQRQREVLALYQHRRSQPWWLRQAAAPRR